MPEPLPESSACWRLRLREIRIRVLGNIGHPAQDAFLPLVIARRCAPRLIVDHDQALERHEGCRASDKPRAGAQSDADNLFPRPVGQPRGELRDIGVVRFNERSCLGEGTRVRGVTDPVPVRAQRRDASSGKTK